MNNFLSKYGYAVQFTVGALILFLFTYHGFFAPKDCTNGEFLYCHLHPASFGAVIGVILFYAAAAVIIGVPGFFGYQPTTNSRVPVYSIGAVVAAVIGIILIYA